MNRDRKGGGEFKIRDQPASPSGGGGNASNLDRQSGFKKCDRLGSPSEGGFKTSDQPPNEGRG